MAKAEKQTEESTAVAVKTSNNLPSHLNLSDIEADAGKGAENIHTDNMQIPILSVLQANSPQCKKSDGKYIKGAEEGMFFNNVTNEVYSGEEGLTVIPCFFEMVFIEWKPNRGGFVEMHPANTPLQKQIKYVLNAEGKEVPTLPNGNLLIETAQYYVLRLKADGSLEPAVLAMSSSALGTSRKWNYLIKSVNVQGSKGQFNPASYYCHYRITTKPRQNDQYSWFGMIVENLGPVPTNDVYLAGKALEKAVNSGEVRVKQEQTDAGAPATAGATAQDDEIPF